MSTDGVATTAPTDLSEKQRRILGYLREAAGAETYFKSRLVAEELDMTAKEVGANMRALRRADHGLLIEKWGYSSGTTWKVTEGE
jgi:DNA-binding MarR family transcriptional regulator